MMAAWSRLGWYVMVAPVFSSARPRRAYLRSKRRIDRAAESIVGTLGLKLMLEAGRPS